MECRSAIPRGRWAACCWNGSWRTAARRDGGYKAYLEREVASSLRDRQLLSAVNARTPAGVRASEQLDAWMEISERDLFTWSHDQTWLQAYLSGAGAAVFLAHFANPSQPVLKHIGTAVAACPSAGTGRSPRRRGTRAGWTSPGSPTASTGRWAHSTPGFSTGAASTAVEDTEGTEGAMASTGSRMCVRAAGPR